MTEAEWDACADPRPMLDFLRGKASDRKLRLFAVACCRRFWTHLRAPSLREAVEASERCADGLATDDEMAAACESVRGQPQLDRLGIDFKDFPNAATDEEEGWALWEQEEMTSAVASAASAVAWLCTPGEIGGSRARSAARSLVEAAAHETVRKEISERRFQICESPEDTEQYLEIRREPERLVQASILRCLCGPLPLRPAPAVDHFWLAWNGGTIAKLAAAIYEERRFGNLPILADALEDAGCSDAAILAHCRTPGEHVRGCWVVDLLLGKS
jgi:hypothetical protein